MRYLAYALLGLLLIPTTATSGAKPQALFAIDWQEPTFKVTWRDLLPGERAPAPAPEVAAPADFRSQVPASGGAGISTVRLGRLLIPDLTAAVAGGALPVLRESVERIDGAASGWSGGGGAGAGYGRGYGSQGGYSGRGPIRRFFARAPLRRLGSRLFGGMRGGRLTVRFRSGRGG